MLIPDDPDERQTYALRIVAQRCLYGVDKNPLAAEMAKLSLVAADAGQGQAVRVPRPRHPLRRFAGRHSQPRATAEVQPRRQRRGQQLFLHFLDQKIKEAIALRRQITAMQANTVEDIQHQEALLHEFEERTEKLRYAADSSWS